MAWEVWYMPFNDFGYGKLGFFCNTADVSFGPVVYVSYSYDVRTVVGAIYEHWDEACRQVTGMAQDPRSMSNEHRIYEIAKKCLVMAELEDEEGED